MVMETKAEAVDVRNGTTNGTLQGKASNNLNSNNVVMERSEPDGDCKPLGLDRAAYNQGANAQYDFSVESDKIGTQTAKGPGAVCTSVVRRLTPLECERLQLFPDNWTRIGTPKTFVVNDYEAFFDREKYERLKPNIDDYVPKEKQDEYELSSPPDAADLMDEDYYDELYEGDPDYESAYDDDEDWIAYRKADDKARNKAFKHVKVGSHTEEGYEWVDDNGKKHRLADSSRYKAMGNSIARPWWKWLARRICAEYERPVTMGSLFDGVGGFPLCFAECGATPVWASEIEPFCIAVTKQHFGDDDKGTKGDWREFV